jgi:endonuclease G
VAKDRNEVIVPAPGPRGRREPSVVRHGPDAGDETPLSQRRGDAIHFDVPLRISVSLGEARLPGARTSMRVSPQRAREDYADREGYDRRFLRINVPFPTMKSRTQFGGVMRVPRPARPNDRFELRYHRFSVIMNGKRRLAYVSACNVNFDPPESATRDEGSQSWHLDPRLDNDQQLGAAYYDGNPYDKGHLTRRDDTAWGSDKEDALAANWDTFHYTNSGLQHELFNRSDEFTGANLDLWGDLENHISAQGGAQRTRLSIFNGPIFGNEDKPLDDALVPLAYFKIVIWRDKNQPPGALGFVLEQNDLIRTLPEEAIEVGRFHIRQKRISSIESKLDISFGAVTEWDQMPRTHEATESLDEEGIPLTSVNDIVFGGIAGKPKRSHR